MTHASLFSGIGGFDLAAEWAGWTNIFNCEIDPFCQQILKYHFPNATQYSDIKSTDFTIWRGKIDVLTGGFPCQPFSQAGKRKGTEDDRHLWPQMLRAIREIRPRWVVGENVLGIVNWSNGLVFEQVCADLEAQGYEVQPYLLPACGVGAPHQRYRVWFVAHRAGERWHEGRATSAGQEQSLDIQRCTVWNESVRFVCERTIAYCSDTGVEAMRERQDGVHADQITTNPDSFGLQSSVQSTGIDPQERKVSSGFAQISAICYWRTPHAARWQNFPTQSPVCGRDDGVSGGLDGITFPKWRMLSIKGYGNAIVPQVAYHIFEAINEFEIQNELCKKLGI